MNRCCKTQFGLTGGRGGGGAPPAAPQNLQDASLFISRRLRVQRAAIRSGSGSAGRKRRGRGTERGAGRRQEVLGVNVGVLQSSQSAGMGSFGAEEEVKR